MKKPRNLFLLIILITIVSFFITATNTVPGFPNFQIRFQAGPVSFVRDLSFRLGLDLIGGTSVTMRAEMQNISPQDRNSALESAKNVIERRVNLFGVSEPVIQTAKAGDEYRIIVELPGVKNVNEAVALVGKTAQLDFREVKEGSASALLLPTVENTQPVDLTGADLKDSQATFDQRTGQPVVSFRVSDKSQNKFFETTQKLVGKRMAIFLDNQFLSAPVVQSAIRDSGQITGNFATEEAKALALELNAGALPVPMTPIEQRTIGATLGAESIRKSLLAGLIGFVLIVVFMAALYGWLGILADVALIVYALLVLSIFKLFPITLTLAGIAGFILSIGMAVDANILIFERMAEEKRSLKSQQIATELGFIRAWTSIRDSNISSLITCAILYQFGTGIVRGFAVTLALGILVSMFSAIVVTRTFLRLIIRT